MACSWRNDVAYVLRHALTVMEWGSAALAGLEPQEIFVQLAQYDKLHAPADVVDGLLALLRDAKGDDHRVRRHRALVALCAIPTLPADRLVAAVPYSDPRDAGLLATHAMADATVWRALYYQHVQSVVLHESTEEAEQHTDELHVADVLSQIEGARRDPEIRTALQRSSVAIFQARLCADLDGDEFLERWRKYAQADPRVAAHVLELASEDRVARIPPTEFLPLMRSSDQRVRSIAINTLRNAAGGGWGRSRSR